MDTCRADHEAANVAAALIMAQMFGVDITTHPNFQYEKSPAQEYFEIRVAADQLETPLYAHPPQQADAIKWPDSVAKRLAEGAQFNAYNRSGGGFVIGLGPVTNALFIAKIATAPCANMLVDVLRIAAGQPLQSCPVEEIDDDD